MALLTITQTDLDKLIKPEAGYHLVKLMTADEKPAKDGKSTNIIFDFQVQQDGSNKDRYIQQTVSRKALALGLVPILCALEDISREDIKEGEIDTDALIGKKCFVYVKEEEYLGRLQSKIDVFLPLSKEPAELVG